MKSTMKWKMRNNNKIQKIKIEQKSSKDNSNFNPITSELLTNYKNKIKQSNFLNKINAFNNIVQDYSNEKTNLQKSGRNFNNIVKLYFNENQYSYHFKKTIKSLKFGKIN